MTKVQEVMKAVDEVKTIQKLQLHCNKTPHGNSSSDTKVNLPVGQLASLVITVKTVCMNR